jgi:hypothetical protein
MAMHFVKVYFLTGLEAVQLYTAVYAPPCVFSGADEREHPSMRGGVSAMKAVEPSTLVIEITETISTARLAGCIPCRTTSAQDFELKVARIELELHLGGGIFMVVECLAIALLYTTCFNTRLSDVKSASRPENHKP